MIKQTKVLKYAVLGMASALMAACGDDSGIRGNNRYGQPGMVSYYDCLTTQVGQASDYRTVVADFDTDGEARIALTKLSGAGVSGQGILSLNSYEEVFGMIGGYQQYPYQQSAGTPVVACLNSSPGSLGTGAIQNISLVLTGMDNMGRSVRVEMGRGKTDVRGEYVYGSVWVQVGGSQQVELIAVPN